MKRDLPGLAQCGQGRLPRAHGRMKNGCGLQPGIFTARSKHEPQPLWRPIYSIAQRSLPHPPVHEEIGTHRQDMGQDAEMEEVERTQPGPHCGLGGELRYRRKVSTGGWTRPSHLHASDHM